MYHCSVISDYEVKCPYVLTTKTLVHAFISSRIDYYNSLLYGLPEYQLNKLQRVQNMYARLICNESKYCYITPEKLELNLKFC